MLARAAFEKLAVLTLFGTQNGKVGLTDILFQKLKSLTLIYKSK
jgi:hypothetical protein